MCTIPSAHVPGPGLCKRYMGAKIGPMALKCWSAPKIVELKDTAYFGTFAAKIRPVALIKSISGIRGTIGGTTGENLTPLDVVRFTAAYGSMLLDGGGEVRVVIGRDGRISGPMVSSLVAQTLRAMGIGVIDLGPSTTPTVEMAVVAENASGGIIITASHNPQEWNALKLLNAAGEFISAEAGATAPPHGLFLVSVHYD